MKLTLEGDKEEIVDLMSYLLQGRTDEQDRCRMYADQAAASAAKADSAARNAELAASRIVEASK